VRVHGIFSAFAAACLVAVSAAAIAEPLPGPEVRALVKGKRLLLSTPYGVDLPLNYKADGTVSGDLSGFSVSSMLAPREIGKWWIEGRRLCQKWPNWLDGKTSCFTLSIRDDGAITWVRQDGLKGTARIGG
jgi:hypothetical protein